MAASFLRMFYTEKVKMDAAVDLKISKFDIELKSLLFEACRQLERRGPFLSKMAVSKIAYRKLLDIYIFQYIQKQTKINSNSAMDQSTYRVNECVCLIYLMEASMDATCQLYNGKLFDIIQNSKKKDVNVDTNVLGYKGNSYSSQ